MPEPIKVVSFDKQEEMIVCRLVTGVIHQWDRIPKRVQGEILRDATLAHGAGPEITPLREQITAFIHKHAGDRP